MTTESEVQDTLDKRIVDMEKKDSIAQIEELMAKCGVCWETLAQKTRQPQWIIDAVKNGKVANSTTINAIVNVLKEMEAALGKAEEKQDESAYITDALLSTPPKSKTPPKPKATPKTEKKVVKEQKPKTEKKFPAIKQSKSKSYVIYPNVNRSKQNGFVSMVKNRSLTDSGQSGLKVKLGNEIKHRRVSLGKSVAELAEYLKISVATLEEIERGESPLSIFQYREINRKLITGDFGKVQASSDVHTRRPKGYGAQHTRKEWTNVVIRRK